MATNFSVNRAYVFLSMILAFLLFSALACGQLPERKPMEALVEVGCVGEEVDITVFERDGSPIYNVDVEIYFDGDKVLDSSTDSDGMVFFTPEDAGIYEIVLTKSRYKGEELDMEVAVCPTCDDGIQNQNESGVDCGGSCPPCSGTTTSKPTTSSSTSTTSSSTTSSSSTTTSSSSTTSKPTTSTSTTTSKPAATSTEATTSTSLAGAPGGLFGFDPLLAGAVLAVFIAAAAFFLFLRGRGEPGEEPLEKPTSLQREYAKAAKKPAAPFKTVDPLERQMLGLDEEKPPVKVEGSPEKQYAKKVDDLIVQGMSGAKGLGKITPSDDIERQLMGLEEKKQAEKKPLFGFLGEKKPEEPKKPSLSAAGEKSEKPKKPFPFLGEKKEESKVVEEKKGPELSEEDRWKKELKGMDLISEELDSLDKLGDELKELRSDWEKRQKEKKK